MAPRARIRNIFQLHEKKNIKTVGMFLDHKLSREIVNWLY